MNEKVDLQYLCTHLGNLSGMPVRLYEKNDLSYCYSLIALPKDPFLPYRKEIFALSDHVGYTITSHDVYYGMVRFGDRRIVVGPTRQIPLSEQDARKIAFDLGVPVSDLPAFLSGLRSIVPMPLMSMLQMLCMVNHIVNDGEILSLSDVSIIDDTQKNLVRTQEKEAAERSFDPAEISEPVYLHNTMDIEKRMLSLVRDGDVEGLKSFFANAPAIRGGILAQDGLRQAKNLLIVSATLSSRAAIQGGLDLEEALALSDEYVQKCELLSDFGSVTNLNYRLVMDYAERVKGLRYGDNPSKLVAEVKKYVRKHLSEPITVQDLALHLSRGRSRLSTDFKKQTGENLSDYIQRQKIEEGKKLLVHTDKPSVEIALYLGFSSQSHFSRAFKKYTDKTPNEYRHEKWNA